jgi:uroporphyrinogen-III synthase
MKTVFISKNSHDLSLLPSFCKNNNIRLIAQSLIDFREIAFQGIQPYDTLFVNSIRAFEFFTKSSPIPNDCEIACVGNTTAEKLRKLGYSPAFVGAQAGNPTLVAKDFKHWIGDKRVLIPCSSLSARSIAKELDPAQVTELIVYETVLNPAAIEQADAYIFTSPSNVNSFFTENKTGNSIVIAWGRATQQALNLLGVKNTITMIHSKEEEAITMLEQWL